MDLGGQIEVMGCDNLSSLLKWAEEGFCTQASEDRLEHEAFDMPSKIGDQPETIGCIHNPKEELLNEIDHASLWAQVQTETSHLFEPDLDS